MNINISILSNRLSILSNKLGILSNKLSILSNIDGGIHFASES